VSRHRRLRQFGIALALAGALGFGARPAAARVPGGRESRLVQAEPGLFQSAWHWLTLFAANWTGMDPNGQPAAGATTDSRTSLDPNGRAATPPPTAATADNWTGMDPDGAH
jgi:hypothetical protein